MKVKRVLGLLIVFSVVGLALGWGIGSYLAYNRATAIVAHMPACPVVVYSQYDKDKHELAIALTNPGFVPLVLVGKSVAFRPASGQGGYVIANLRARLKLPGQTTQVMVLKLKPETPELAVGDVIAATIEYQVPGTKDVYQLVHVFKNSSGAEKKEAGR